MSYTILPYTQQQAKKLGVSVRPSTNPKKKIDVYEGGQKVASVGATGYKDYPTYQREDGKAIAEERRRLYHLRHAKDSQKKGTPGYYASLLLW
ncbi:hypothetical protein EBT25_06085 [bacterium]|nr:hypothetical protein [bacterium]